MKESLRPGLEFTHTYRIPEDKTVPFVFPESSSFQKMPKVLATAFLVGLMEWACIEALNPHLEEGEISVGIHIDVSHVAATPPGLEVAVKVKCTEVDGLKTRWEIEAHDEVELIGKGTHERFTVDLEKFNARVAKKASG